VVISAVGEHDVGLLARASGLAADRPGVELIQQWEELGDVVAVAAGERDRERDAGRVDQQVVL
jgi:hypothetical protein